MSAHRVDRILLVAVMCSSMLAAAQVDVLDLTRVRPSPWSGTEPRNPRAGSTTGFESHTPSERLSLEVKLDSLDSDSYLDGEPFEFRVTLKNIGNRPVVIPWEPDAQRVVTEEAAPMLKALIAISADTSPRRLMIPIATLYGSAMSPMTVKRLGPGDQAQIIAQGRWNFMGYSSESLRAQDISPRLRILAELHFLTAFDGHRYGTVESTNRLPITLGRR